MRLQFAFGAVRQQGFQRAAALWWVQGKALAFLALIICSAHAQTSAVTVIDHLSAGQQEETIAVFFAGHLAGTLHIDQAHPDDTFTAALDGAGRIHYTLCGLLRRREPDGTVSEHRIDNGGELDAVSGGSYAALTLDDKLFALVDAVTGMGAQSLTPGPACAAAVS